MKELDVSSLETYVNFSTFINALFASSMVVNRSVTKSVLPDNINQNAQGYVTTLSGKESNFDSVNEKQKSTQSNPDQALDKILHDV